jgi:ferritin-like metal-binding protein YciE
MTKINSLQELLIDEMHDLYDAETQLLKALPKMAEAATDPQLKAGFEGHWEQTKGHAARLEQALSGLGEKPRGKTCQAMAGMIKEGQESSCEKGPDALRDANLIGAAQRVEHYEIAAYGTARAFADALGLTEISTLLKQTLDEEAATDRKLTELARRVNQDALHAA